MIQAGKDALENYGAGLSSVRFICGTQDIHKVTISHHFIKIKYCYPITLKDAEFISLNTPIQCHEGQIAY